MNGKHWRLMTDDTALCLGIDAQGRLAITELTSRVQGFNWTEPASPIPFLRQVEAAGKIHTLDWIFQKSATDDSDGTKLALHFTSDALALELKSEWHAGKGAGPIRHAAFITNRSGISLRLFHQPTLAVRLAAPGGADDKLWMWSFHSDGVTPHWRGLFREEVVVGLDRLARTQPGSLMNTSELIPFVALDCDSRHGIYIGMEWSMADIRLKGLPEPGPLGVALEAGCQDFNASLPDFAAPLDPGETFAVPPGFLGAYVGDIDDAGNSLRRYLFRYSMPAVLRDDPTYPKVQWNACLATGKTPGSWDCEEKKYYPLIDDIAPLGFEEVMIDVGWWQGQLEAAWLDKDPEADPVDWPSGMRKAADYAHRHGLRFGLYWSDAERMAEAKGRKARAERIKRLFLEYGADLWRSDATQGLVLEPSYGATKGFYEMVDGLQREIANFQWENCSGGGALKDYGAMRRGVKIFMSDTYSPLDVRRAFHDGAYAFHPIQLMGHLSTCGAAWRNVISGAEGLKYAFRCMSMGAPEWILDAPNGGNGGDAWTEAEKVAVKAAVGTWKTRIRPLIRNANLYHILPRPNDKVWDGIEYFDPAQRNGVAFIFKPDNDTDTQSIRLRGLNPQQSYRLTFEDRTNPQADVCGAQLAKDGIPVTLKGKFVSELMFFEEVTA